MGQFGLLLKLYGLIWCHKETGRFGSGFGPALVSAQTGFGSQQVLGRHEFPHETSFGSGRVSYRFDAYRLDPYRFDPYRFDPYRFDRYRFDTNRFDQYRFDGNHFDPCRFNPYRFNQYHFHPYRFNQYRFDANRFDAYRSDPYRFDHYRFEPIRFAMNRFSTMNVLQKVLFFFYKFFVREFPSFGIDLSETL
ncbi:hypothetical protein Hanom_Chr05g00411181 [Helianthus anomalus]